MTHTYDVAIIGAGSAGLAALRETRRHTDNFVIINDGPYGTTCARVGCMPSKALIESANAFHRRAAFDTLGIRGGDALRLDIAGILQRVRRLRDAFTKDIIAITSELGERSIAGRAQFLAPETLEVNGKRVHAKRIVIATGSSPIVPPEWRRLGKRLVTSDSLFDQRSLPQRIAVIGMGAVGTELAQALARLGLEIVAFGADKTVAGLSDPDINAALIERLRAEMTLHLDSRAHIEAQGPTVHVTAGRTTVVVDAVLAALGRQPNIEALALERLGLPLDERGLPPFDRTTRQIADLPIYIAGDVAQELPLLHEAADDGYVAGTNATRDEAICFERRTRSMIVFSDPNAAVIGTPFKNLDPQAIAIGKVSFATQGRATLAADNYGALHVYVARENSRLLGAELCAPRGEHLAHLLALAIGRECTVHDFLRMPFYHPTFEEGLRIALRHAAKQLGFNRQSDLANCRAVGATALD
jgi:dihydrolipoamide dehydrogenase